MTLRALRALAVAIVCALTSGCGITVFGSDEGPQTATFAVVDSRLVMSGVIDEDTVERLHEVVENNPQATTIVMRNVTGAADGEVNVALAREVRRLGLATFVPTDGRISAGATDVLIGGTVRVAERGASIGIRAWGDEDDSGADLPISDEAHAPWLQFYRDMGIAEEFYWFMLRSAGPEDVYWMSADELFRFRVVHDLR